MVALSAVDFFSKAFTWFANISAKLPKIDFKTYFIVVISLLIGVGVIVALTFFGTYRFKLTRSCRKIIRYLQDVEFIDDDNVSDFTSQCFSSKAPSALRDCWVQYLGVRFGYPSDILSEQNLYDKEVKRVREIRANVYIAVALVLMAVFSFWGYGTLESRDMGVIFCAGLLLSGVIYLVLVILNKMQSKACMDSLSTMQEDLDAKVILQVEKSFATDSSPLADLSAIVDEIIARNTAKDIGFDLGEVETPIEMLISQSAMTVQYPSQQDESTLQEESVEDVEEIEEDLDGITGQSAEVISDEVEQEEVVEEIAEVVEDSEEELSVEEPETVETEEQENDSDYIIEDEEIIEESKEQQEETENASEEVEDASEETVEEVESVANTETVSEDGQEDPESETAENVAEQEVAEEYSTAGVADKNEEDKSEEEALADEVGGDGNDNGDNMREVAGDVEPKESVKILVVDEYSDDEETVKPAKLVKLPNLVDYMLARKPSRKVLMKIAAILLSAYKKFEDSEEDKKIVINCMKKVMKALQNTMKK